MIRRCKGMRDRSPEEMRRFRLIEGLFRQSCEKWGYQEVRTPTLEYLHLFTSAGTLTSSMLGKVYSFLDWDGWSGERVVLRPDGTIPIARLYIDSMAGKGPTRLFYVTNIFIFEETGEQARERWQCGVELVGAGSALSDVELISLAGDVLKKLKLENVEVRLSHAGLIKEVLLKLGLNQEEQAEVFDQILDGNREALSRIGKRNPDLESIILPALGEKGQSAGFLKNLKALSAQALPEVGPYLDNFIEVAELLDKLEYKYEIDVASGAGFEYYTGVIFQFFAGSEKIGGGGRYDALIPAMGGGKVPASGFALYLDPLMAHVGRNGLAATQQGKVQVKSSTKGTTKVVFDIARRLREAGYVVELDLTGKESTESRWTLDVGAKAPKFALWDRVKCRRLEAETAGEILKALGGQGADKGSLT